LPKKSHIFFLRNNKSEKERNSGMFRNIISTGFTILLAAVLSGCSDKETRTNKKGTDMIFTGANGEVVLMTVAPGHFHAGLLQKTMYDRVSPTAYVYAPEGSGVEVHLKRIEDYNSRADNPTCWEEIVYTGPDYFEKMLGEKPGNVMIVSGNNRKKTEYIKQAVDNGINVFSDKPMCIDRKGFELLEKAFESADEKGVLLYDIMTERYEIATILQKELAHTPEVFGEFTAGTPGNPSVIKESVHHLFKYISGVPIQRPGWFFDVAQQGEGIVDIGTHLVDMVMWGCFPEKIVHTSDIEILSARHWPTMVTRSQYEKVTGLVDFSDFLKDRLDENGVLPYFCNGEMTYRIKNIHARVSVVWNFEAPAGAGDTHYSIMKGTKANVIILQDREQNYRPELYVEKAEEIDAANFEGALNKAVEDLQAAWPGVGITKEGGRWHVLIPDKYRVGHEAHFAQVTEKYLRFLAEGTLPGWEVPNMIAKYYTTTAGLEMAKR
jgi:predicted dehydrogenase